MIFPDDDTGPSVTIGLDPQGNPTADLDLSFTQGSFGATAPAFEAGEVPGVQGPLTTADVLAAMREVGFVDAAPKWVTDRRITLFAVAHKAPR